MRRGSRVSARRGAAGGRQREVDGGSPSPSTSARSMSAVTTSGLMARFMSISTCLSSSRETVPVLSSSMVRKALRICVKRVSMWFLMMRPARRSSSSDLRGAARGVCGRCARGEREIGTRCSTGCISRGGRGSCGSGRGLASCGLSRGRGCAPGWAGATLGSRRRSGTTQRRAHRGRPPSSTRYLTGRDPLASRDARPRPPAARPVPLTSGGGCGDGRAPPRCSAWGTRSSCGRIAT